MITKIHSELSFWLNNPSAFTDATMYFDKLYIQLKTIFETNKKDLYLAIFTYSSNDNQIFEILDIMIQFYQSQDKFENCIVLQNIKNDVLNIYKKEVL